MALSFIDNNLRLNVAKTQRKLAVHLINHIDYIRKHIDEMYVDIDKNWDGEFLNNQLFIVDAAKNHVFSVVELIEKSESFITETIQKFCSTLIFDSVTEIMIECLSRIKVAVLNIFCDIHQNGEIDARKILYKLDTMGTCNTYTKTQQLDDYCMCCCECYRRTCTDIDNFGPKLR